MHNDHYRMDNARLVSPDFVLTLNTYAK